MASSAGHPRPMSLTRERASPAERLDAGGTGPSAMSEGAMKARRGGTTAGLRHIRVERRDPTTPAGVPVVRRDEDQVG
jgi:hypothetical protein